MTKKGKIIRNGIEYSGGGGSGDIMYLTQAEYDALPDTKLSDNVEYRITDASIEAAKASNISYDNSFSGLDANNVQGAVDTLTESLEELQNSSLKVQYSLNNEFNVATSGAETNITFNEPYTEIPLVTVSMIAGTGSATWKITSISKTGFTVKGIFTKTTTLDGYWMAIGK